MIALLLITVVPLAVYVVSYIPWINLGNQWFAGFPAGMVIYWTWSNVLSILQQYWIMRRQGVETQFDQFLKRFGKPAEDQPLVK